MMNVLWSPEALTSLEKIRDYIMDTFGFGAAMGYIDEVERNVAMLQHNPLLGAQERYARNLPFECHSIVVARKTKLVYEVCDDEIHILAVWDTRQEPNARASSLRRLPIGTRRRR